MLQGSSSWVEFIKVSLASGLYNHAKGVMTQWSQVRNQGLISRAYRMCGLLEVGGRRAVKWAAETGTQGEGEGRKTIQTPRCLKLTTVKVSITFSSSSPSPNKLGFSEN